jgi:hypothetical protein
MPSSWTAPTTKATGDVITATIWNNLLGASGSLQYLYDNLPPAQYTWITKSADETVNNSSTLQNDDSFTFTTTASTDYYVELDLYLTSATATPDLKFAWTMTGMTWDGWYANSPGATATYSFAAASAQTSGTAISITSGNIPTSSPLHMSFMIHSGSTGGTLNFQWAQNTATVENTTVKKNSLLKYRTVGAS